ncbi:hypothetical protein QAD02_016270 [Eretmocerus hayati]|uniref:Uncharacterized protein n=1 Tax=Eretmocerus hayati TaxID=131215 RepID=A0ACC2PAL9_9HYME|nr:hypothetical protein QAD02_016270 [Eretmocerus hayati]
MTSSDPKNCSLCNKSGARSCSKCHSISYCSTRCQKRDWSTHKLLCASFASFDNSSRPTDEHVRAIFFPVDDSRPQIAWLRCCWHDREGIRCHYVDTSPFLGLDKNNRVKSRTDEVSNNPILSIKLSDLIYINYWDSSHNDELKGNKSIANILASKGNIHFWQSPVIAYGIKGLGRAKEIIYRDLEMVDFRHIVDYLCESHSYRVPRTIKPNIVGVRINCDGDREICNRPAFELVEVPPTDRIFAEPNTDSDIASCIGLPIITRRYPLQKYCTEKCSNFTNVLATFLNLSCYDPKLGTGRPHQGELGWGWAPMTWQNDVGSILVVRQDKKPMSLWHIEALCNYCKVELQPVFEAAMEENSLAGRREVMSMINQADFLRYWKGNFLRGIPVEKRLGTNIYIPTPYDF